MQIRDLAVGDTHRAVVVDDLSRTQIVMYAGASGDYNPLHTDEVYAVAVAGYDRVIAHGQLTMGLTAKLVTQWLDECEMSAFGVRFLRQVWPGDTLTTTATVTTVSTADERDEAELSLSTANQDGIDVVTGYARVFVDKSGP